MIVSLALRRIFEPFARWMNDPNGLCRFHDATICSTNSIRTVLAGTICTGAMQ